MSNHVRTSVLALLVTALCLSQAAAQTAAPKSQPVPPPDLLAQIAQQVTTLASQVQAQSTQLQALSTQVQTLSGQVQALTNAIGPERLASNERSRLLVPFVSNQAGFDTGVAIANTGAGATGARAGRCTVSYYSPFSPPAPQTTNADVPVGGQLTFTLSGGGSNGISATPGFQGYLEIACDFPFAHGFAYLSGLGDPYSGASLPVLVLGATRNSAIVEGAGQ